MRVQIAFASSARSINQASFRLRCNRVIDELSHKGVDAHLYKNGMIPKILIISKIYDHSYLRKLTNLKKEHNTKLFLDLCDNHFLDSNKAQIIQRLLLDLDGIIVTTNELKNVVNEQTNLPIYVIPDLLERFEYNCNSILQRIYYKLKFGIIQTMLKKNRKYNLIWFGNAKNSFNNGGVNDLLLIKERLDALKDDFCLLIVSNSFWAYFNIKKQLKIKTVYCPFDIYTMPAIFERCAVCVLPISIDEFSSCKSTNRIETLLYYKIAVWTDSVPSYLNYIDYININDWNNFVEDKINEYRINIKYESKDSEVIKMWMDIANYAT